MKHISLAFFVIMLPASLQAIAELPDPTRPADYQAAPKVIYEDVLPKELIDWTVTAIRIAGEERTAIVNGQLVRVGDVIGPATVVDIEPISVILDYQQNTVVVRLYSKNLVEKKARN